MATSVAAPLIVCAFRRVRRSTSTDAFQCADIFGMGPHIGISESFLASFWLTFVISAGSLKGNATFHRSSNCR
jgi:hypothetical protein